MEQVSFGYRTAWLALRTEGRDAVVRALGLRNVVPATPTVGIQRSNEWDPAAVAGPVFVSPPVHGWMLCVGQAWLTIADARPPAFGDLVARLSGELRCDAQFFCTHRVVESHGWARAVNGKLLRAYLYVGESGETPLNYGEPTPDELHLGFALFAPSADGGSRAAASPAEEDVIRLAARWSVNPTSLPAMADGVLGELPGRTAESATRSRTSGASGTGSKPWWKVW